MGVRAQGLDFQGGSPWQGLAHSAQSCTEPVIRAALVSTEVRLLSRKVNLYKVNYSGAFSTFTIL